VEAVEARLALLFDFCLRPECIRASPFSGVADARSKS
jgi:hypothetical protein